MPTEAALSSKGGIARSMLLLQFGDSVLPIGAFAFSNALETAIQLGIVRDVATLHDFTRTATRQSAFTDGIAVLHSHRAALGGRFDAALSTDQALFERKLNEESRLMSVRMGKKLAQIGCRVRQDDNLARWLEAIEEGRTPGTLPATLGVLVAELGSPEEDAFAIMQYGAAYMILSAALRLMKVDHMDVQTILFEVDGHVPGDYQQVTDAALGDMASFSPTIDILAAIHRTSHVRLFMN